MQNEISLEASTELVIIENRTNRFACYIDELLLKKEINMTFKKIDSWSDSGGRKCSCTWVTSGKHCINQ